MSDKIEAAKSSRSACRQCGEKIQKGTLRFGEEYESEYGISFRWYHLPCAAEKLPALLKKTLEAFDGEVPDRDAIDAILEGGSTEPKEILPDYPDVSLAPTGRASCIQCGEKIEKGSTRIAVEVDMEIRGRSTRGAGYMHPACVGAWLGENEEVDPDEFNRIVTAKGGEASKAAAPERAPLPEIAGKSEKQLRALGKKLMKLRDNYRIGDALTDAVGWKDREAVFFHLLEHDVVHPGKNVYLALLLSDLLRDRVRTGAQMERELTLVEHTLSKIPSTVQYKENPFLPNLPTAVFELASLLWKRAPDRAGALYTTAKPNIQVAIALGMALDEAELPEGAADELTKALAPLIGRHEPTLYGVWDDRVLDLDALVEGLGTQAILTEAAIEKLRRGRDLHTATGLMSAFREAPPKAALSGLDSFLAYNSRPSTWSAVRAAFAERSDLETLAEQVAKDEQGDDRERLFLFGLLDSLPEGFPESLTFSKLSSYDGEFVPEYVRVLETIGEQRALALGQRALEQDNEYRKHWVPLLHQVFGDAALPLLVEALQAGLTRYAHLAPEASLSALGEADLDEDKRTSAQVAIAVELNRLGKDVPEALDDAIVQRPRTLTTFAGRFPLERAIALVEASMLEHPPEVVLAALPKAPAEVRQRAIQLFVERRKKIKKTRDARQVLSGFPDAARWISECLGDVDPGEKKFFGILEKAFNKETYAELASQAGVRVETTLEKLERLMTGGERTTLFFPAKGELESLREETLSYVGDTPPPGVDAPSGKEEDKRHILTMDLSPFPDLVTEFGAETMSLFVEAPNSGEFNDGAVLIGSGKLDAIPDGGRPLEVGALRLPDALRSSGRKAPQKELRAILGRCTGHAFGPAYWIQENLGDSVTLQLNDAYMNLGDSGSLYIGDFGTTWQCF